MKGIVLMKLGFYFQALRQSSIVLTKLYYSSVLLLFLHLVTAFLLYCILNEHKSKLAKHGTVSVSVLYIMHTGLLRHNPQKTGVWLILMIHAHIQSVIQDIPRGYEGFNVILLPICNHERNMAQNKYIQ